MIWMWRPRIRGEMQMSCSRSATSEIPMGISLHRVDYLVRSRNIQPIARAGHLRVFGEETNTTLRREPEAA